MALKLYGLREYLHQAGRLNISVHFAETLLDHLSFPVLTDWLAMHCLLLRVLYDVLQSQDPLPYRRKAPYVFFDAGLNDKLSSLVAIVLDEVIDNQLIGVEKVPEWGKGYS